jgi:Cys-tRNA(Pro)/Cys-tRNA(Cys) deacylase
VRKWESPQSLVVGPQQGGSRLAACGKIKKLTHEERSAASRSPLADFPEDWRLATVPKTNAARLLDQLGIHYELRDYEVDPEDLAAETVAHKIGLPTEQVFKTLVAQGDRHGICMAVIPGDAELDLKALAVASGNRKIQLVPVKELQALTGYIRGGVTALAGKKNYSVYVDETIELFDVVSISAGVRGLQILLAPADYLRATKGTVAPLSHPKG